MFDLGNGAKRAIFTLLHSGWVEVRGVVFEDGAYLANWWSRDLGPRVYVAEPYTEMTITWPNWGEVVLQAYRGVELVLTA